MKGICFKEPLFDATLAGTKDVTRRDAPQPIIDADSGYVFDPNHKHIFDIYNWKEQYAERFSRYKVGEKVFLKEPYCFVDGRLCYKYSDGKSVTYIYSEEGDNPIKWRNKLFMKAIYARFHIEIVSCRIEQLKEITEEDCIREGILFYDAEIMGRRYKDYLTSPKGYGHPDFDYPCVSTAVESYQTLWKKINGKDSWNPDMWLFRYEYELCK